MAPDQRLIAALDTANAAQATAWAAMLRADVGLFKLGLEFFLAHGPSGIRRVTDASVFLDLKLHDIPNTVAGAVRAILPLRPRMLTVHASGGTAMMRAAAEAAAVAGSARPMILAVTVLTSLNATALRETGVAANPVDQVVRLGRLARDSGADGLVCSPQEAASLRQDLGDTIKLVVPGIRPEGTATGDQARTMTPRQAIEAGADWIVVGRPITSAANPAQAAAAIVKSLS